MDYDLILDYYKSFCTQICNLKSFFSDDSTFFFVGDSGDTFIAYGRDDIEKEVDQQFWQKRGLNEDKTLIAYNINIEKKTQINCPLNDIQLFDKKSREVGIALIGTLKAINSNEDISLTKLMGRRFVQTFLIKKCKENYIKSTVFAFLAPTTDLFRRITKTEVSTPLTPICGDIFDNKKFPINEIKSSDLDFEKIVRNIDKLIEENNSSNESFTETKVEVNCNELMPISMNEIFDDNSCDQKLLEINETLITEQYLNDIWSQNRNKDNENEYKFNENEKKEDFIQIKDENESQETNDDHNYETSFADVLRDGLHSFQSVKSEEKTQEIRIITNCGKSKYKQNCLKANGKSELFGQQNITIIGAQNLEEYADNQILFVANIPVGYPKNDFKNLFNIYGKILSTKFVERINISFAFIYFESSKCVDEVFKSTTANNNLYLSGLHLKVDRYRPRIASKDIS